MPDGTTTTIRTRSRPTGPAASSDLVEPSPIRTRTRQPRDQDAEPPLAAGTQSPSFQSVMDNTREFWTWDSAAGTIKASAAGMEALKVLKSIYWRRMRRVALGELSGNEHRVMTFIASRTLDWDKYAEAIPLRHFTDGITDRSDGEVVQCGCGIANRSRLIEATQGLVRRGLISQFDVLMRGQHTKAYTPLPKPLLRHFILHNWSMRVAGDPEERLGRNNSLSQEQVVLARRLFTDGYGIARDLWAALRDGSCSTLAVRMLLDDDPEQLLEELSEHFDRRRRLSRLQ